MVGYPPGFFPPYRLGFLVTSPFSGVELVIVCLDSRLQDTRMLLLRPRPF